MGIRWALARAALASTVLVLSACGGDLLDEYDTASETVEATPTETPDGTATPSESSTVSPKARAQKQEK